MRIVILSYEGISPFMLSTPLAVFGEPFLAAGHEVLVASDTPDLKTIGGMTMQIAHGLDQVAEAALVILPGWRDAQEPVPAALVQALNTAFDTGAIVAGLCLGAFGLAEAGLLDGRRATTHWARTGELSARYRRVTVDPDALFVDEGQVVTSAGIASGLDCCLHLLERLCGSAEARRVARHLVIAPQRGGTDPQLLARPTPVSTTERRIAALLEELRDNPINIPSLQELADQAGVSPRSLTRHIRARTGGSLGIWVRRARLARAKDLLSESGSGLDMVASRSGFADAQALRSAFRTELGMTPRQWLSQQQRRR